MKVVVKVVGHGAQVEVSAGALPRYLEQREMARMLDWAEERGLKYVEWMYPSGRVTATRCQTCREPQLGTCNYCFLQRKLVAGPDTGQLSAEELEHRAQLAERMSVEYARLAIELQGRAATAVPDPIEITVLPPVLSDIDKFEQALSKMLSQSSLIGYSSQQLDQFGLDVGIVRSSHGGFTESDDSLRKRIRAYFDAKKQVMHVDMSAALGLKPGQQLLVNGATAQITDVQIQNGHATIKYTAQVPSVIDTVSVGYTTE